MKQLLLLALLFSAILQADCSKLKLLSLKNQKFSSITSQNSIIWQEQDEQWSASKPLRSLELQKYKCKNDGYVLVNSQNINNKSAILHASSEYDLKKGWNYLHTPKNGLDVVKTFTNNEAVKFVYVYDQRSKAWAGFSAVDSINKELQNTRILSLKYIEPYTNFYAYSSKAIKLNIEYTDMLSICKNKLDLEHSMLFSSGANEKFSFDEKKTIGVKSRYLSHYRKGIYNDTRMALIYPKVKTSAFPKLLRYGPASPRMMINYAKEYEDKEFYVFDYFNKSCYKGIFPSMKRPPVPTLKKLKAE